MKSDSSSQWATHAMKSPGTGVQSSVWLRRVGAFSIDIVWWVLLVFLWPRGWSDAPHYAIWLLFAYRAISHLVCHQTLGKALLGIEVISAESSGPRRFAISCLTRDSWYYVPRLAWDVLRLFAPLPASLFWLLSAFLYISDAAYSVVFDRQRSIHDRIAGTMVVRVNKSLN